jgi:predicted transcriptional regulator
MQEKKLPVEEMVAYDEFTDRVEILRELDLWVKNIQKMTAPSTAIIAPRRMGKTALLDRLVNTVFFKPKYQVAPFYFRMKREDSILRNFLLEYATTFFRQFFAYCYQDAALYSDNAITLEQLLDFSSANQAINVAKEFIEGFLSLYNDPRYGDAMRNQWDGFIRVPERIASYSGIRVAVIIDEFQDMKYYVHNVDEDKLEGIRDRRRNNPDLRGTDLTATYDRQSQSRKAPMLVTGSAVTLVFRTVMGGPLGGRFSLKYLKPLSIPDGAILLQTLIPLYSPETPITPENALYASLQTGGHPYYLYCLSISDYVNKQFDSRQSIDEVIRYEIELGKIYGFWQTHFDNNRKIINADDDEKTGKKILYYFTLYNNQPVQIDVIANKLDIPKKMVEEKIEKLHLADLVYRSAAKFYSFNDICLMRYIKFVYEHDLEDVTKIDLSQQNLFNTLKGHFLEMVVQITMMKFNNEPVDGKLFGKSGTLRAPLFRFVDTKVSKAMRTKQYQIDVFGREKAQNRYWLCECKYTKTRMGMNQVKKLEKAAKVLQQEASDAGLDIPDVVLWVICTGGFTQAVHKHITAKNNFYMSDHDDINDIFAAYGGNYQIPIFQRNVK